ncbi:MAG: VWA domain-containing protein [Clostridiaceae bacterium]|jgi:hypothetical protein|nr:VWA domain-containing protein [Clostridiaceae bacterium]
MNYDNILVIHSKIDMVFCIDGTGDMAPHIESVKNNVKRFYLDFAEEMTKQYSYIDSMRVKIIVFRDYGCDGDEAMKISNWFDLPEDDEELSNYLRDIEAHGGGDAPENGLEALYFAMKQDFMTGRNDRQVIVLFTNADCLELGERKGKGSYPEDMVNGEGLQDMWLCRSQDLDSKLRERNKRLVLFAPSGTKYENLKANLNRSVFEPVAMGKGLGDINFDDIIKIMCPAVAAPEDRRRLIEESIDDVVHEGPGDTAPHIESVKKDISKKKSAVDMVFCIDGTGDMAPHIESVKNNIKRFRIEYCEELEQRRYDIDSLRVKIIVFRDYGFDGDEAMKISQWFELPDDDSDFANYLTGVTAHGGGDAPENGLEALYFAMKSDFMGVSKTDRQIIVLFTNADYLELGERKGAGAYPVDMVGEKGLIDTWMGNNQDPESHLRGRNKRLVLFAPSGTKYENLRAKLDRSVFEPVEMGNGLGDIDFYSVLQILEEDV